MTDYAVKRIDELEGAFGGAFKRARAELGVTSFGLQILDLPPNFDQYPDHDHTHDGQEEVYVTLRGSGEMEIDGQRHPLDPDTIVRVGAGTSRKVWPGPDGIRFLAIGGVPGGQFTPHPATELGGPETPLR